MRNKLYEKRLEICLTVKQYEKLKKYAVNEGITVNEYIRTLLKEFLENQY